MQNNRLSKKILEVPGKRSVGRPTRIFIDSIKNDSEVWEFSLHNHAITSSTQYRAERYSWSLNIDDDDDCTILQSFRLL